MSSATGISRGAPVLGYTTRRHLLLDLDHTDLKRASRIALKVMREWPEVGDCIIMLSSEGSGVVETVYDRFGKVHQVQRRDNYHIIFDNCIGWNKASRICETLAALDILQRGYMKIREFRGDMTLRVSPMFLHEGVKPVPAWMRYIENKKKKREDGMIYEYLSFLSISLKLFSRYSHAEDRADYGPDYPNNNAEVRAIDSQI